MEPINGINITRKRSSELVKYQESHKLKLKMKKMKLKNLNRAYKFRAQKVFQIQRF